ncbi:MAG: GNAT family N-acetyltransferase [Burkholderiaceae bacterium]
MRVRAFRDDESAQWDSFVAAAYGATFLHTRRYLSYHGDRFADRSLVVEDGARWLGVLPLALDPADWACAVSHPGITYGGMLHEGALRGEAMVQALQLATAELRAQGCARLRYKAVPHIYALAPAQDDLYALFRLGATRVRADLSSCIDLAHRLPASERRRRALRKAHEAGITLRHGREQLARLWPVLEGNLERAHGLKPVHTIAEIETLADRFAAQILCLVAERDAQVLAGTVLYASPRTVHAQYVAASEPGRALHAPDLLFQRAIDDAEAMGARYFDFGISTVEHGRVLNEGLHRFKSEFGAGGVVHEHYEVRL